MNVSHIKTPFRGAQWRQQFADGMIALCPELNPDAIDEMADAEYPMSSDIEPALAARRYATARGFVASESPLTEGGAAAALVATSGR